MGIRLMLKLSPTWRCLGSPRPNQICTFCNPKEFGPKFQNRPNFISHSSSSLSSVMLIYEVSVLRSLKENIFPVVFFSFSRQPNRPLRFSISGDLAFDRREIDMGFLVTTLIFVVIGIIASLCTRICCNRGPSTNLFHLTLVITATVCCWMMWAIVYLAQMKPLIVPILSEGE